MWEEEVAVERGGRKRRKWVFGYPNERLNKNCIVPAARGGKSGISQKMIGFFYGQTHDPFFPYFS